MRNKKHPTNIEPKSNSDPTKYPPPQPMAYPLAIVCRDLGVCRATIHNWMKRGILRGVKVGGKRLFAVCEIERLLSEKD
jgi:hypothetical protein